MSYVPHADVRARLRSNIDLALSSRSTTPAAVMHAVAVAYADEVIAEILGPDLSQHQLEMIRDSMRIDRTATIADRASRTIGTRT